LEGLDWTSVAQLLRLWTALRGCGAWEAFCRIAIARPAEAQRQHAAAKLAWQASSQPAWLDKDFYLRKIQPLLSGVTVPVLASALGISEPYAAEIRAGRYLPHPRHWLALARLVGVSPAV
jgi:helix-turn-helix protein